MQRRRAVHAAGLGLVGALALAGCSSQPQSVGDAWQKARTQLDDAQSLRLSSVTTTGRQGPSVVTWDIAGDVKSGDGTSVGTLGVGEDSVLRAETRTVGADAWVRMSAEGPNVPQQLKDAYPDPQWQKIPAGDAQVHANPVRAELDRIALPARDALAGAQVTPEEVRWSGGTAERYAVPGDIAAAAAADGQEGRLRSFTVGEDGSLVGLQMETADAVYQYELSDWNAIKPAVAPEEVAR